MVIGTEEKFIKTVDVIKTKKKNYSIFEYIETVENLLIIYNEIFFSFFN